MQADPIRAPARAQDLTLRHRVNGYRAGDLERRYAALDIEEDVFVNYGFVSRAVHALMHPRARPPRWPPSAASARARALLEFVRERGEVHPREVDAHFAHGTVTNYWGGSSNATTHLLEDMHYRGLLRVARRERGIRIYALRERRAEAADAAAPRERVDALVDVVVQQVRAAAGPEPVVRRRPAALRRSAVARRAEARAARGRSSGSRTRASTASTGTGRPGSVHASSRPPDDRAAAGAVRSGGVGSPPLRAVLGLGLPLRGLHAGRKAQARLLRAAAALARPRHRLGQPVGRQDGALQADVGYVDGRPPRDRAFGRELEAELDRMREFLRLDTPKPTKD